MVALSLAGSVSFQFVAILSEDVGIGEGPCTRSSSDDINVDAKTQRGPNLVVGGPGVG